MRIWPWSRIADLEMELATERACIRGFCADYAKMQSQLNQINTTVGTITPGLGRVIAKLDARFAEDESNASPERKAESNKIAAEVIKRLEAEALAREPYNHDLGDK